MRAPSKPPEVITADDTPSRPNDFLGMPITYVKGFRFPLYKTVQLTLDIGMRGFGALLSGLAMSGGAAHRQDNQQRRESPASPPRGGHVLCRPGASFRANVAPPAPAPLCPLLTGGVPAPLSAHAM